MLWRRLCIRQAGQYRPFAAAPAHQDVRVWNRPHGPANAAGIHKPPRCVAAVKQAWRIFQLDGEEEERHNRWCTASTANFWTLALYLNTMANTTRRVKLYVMNEDRQWDDRGTGYVSSSYVELLQGMALLVRSEEDGNYWQKKKNKCVRRYTKGIIVYLLKARRYWSPKFNLIRPIKNNRFEIWRVIHT